MCVFCIIKNMSNIMCVPISRLPATPIVHDDAGPQYLADHLVYVSVLGDFIIAEIPYFWLTDSCGMD